MHKKGFTLIELIVALTLIGVIAPLVGGYIVYFLRNTLTNQRSANAYMQLEYALEHIRMHCISAIAVDPATTFDGSHDEVRADFCFRGEANIYNIEPNNLINKVNYCYRLDPAGNLVVEQDGIIVETLIDRIFQPSIEFVHLRGIEPDFLRVNIVVSIPENTPTGRRNIPITKSLGVPFWFTEVID